MAKRLLNAMKAYMVLDQYGSKWGDNRAVLLQLSITLLNAKATAPKQYLLGALADNFPSCSSASSTNFIFLIQPDKTRKLNERNQRTTKKSS